MGRNTLVIKFLTSTLFGLQLCNHTLYCNRKANFKFSVVCPEFASKMYVGIVVKL